MPSDPERRVESVARPLDERDAAAYVGFTVSALRLWRRQDRGPSYIQVNRSIRYRVSDLDAWLNAHLVDPVNERIPELKSRTRKP
jgi:predicted DNA-binding transcriptional regulator AlpA